MVVFEGALDLRLKHLSERFVGAGLGSEGVGEAKRGCDSSSRCLSAENRESNVEGSGRRRCHGRAARQLRQHGGGDAAKHRVHGHFCVCAEQRGRLEAQSKGFKR